jgi:signal transduction histidine kinase
MERSALLLLPALGLSFAFSSGAGGFALADALGAAYLFVLGACCFDTGRSVVLYCSLWGMEMHVLVYELCRFAQYAPTGAGDGRLRGLLLRLVISAAVYVSVGCSVTLWLPVYRQRHAGPRQTGSAVMLYLIFSALTWGFFRDGRFLLQGYENLLLLMAQFYCIIVLYLQAALFQSSAIRQERDLIELLWRQQKTQYEQSRESIAIINQKTHDLKHMLAAMRTMESGEQRERYLQEIQKSVDIYDSVVKTGNETLDTVLTEKSLYCDAHGIKVTCVADGQKLDFMDPVDIYTLMGNAMDNAIEGVQRFRQREKRTIDVTIYQRRGLLSVSVTNPLEEELVIEDGIPRSTKPQDGYHGFGVKSMRSTVRKYGGELTVDTRDGCFALNMVFPLNG